MNVSVKPRIHDLDFYRAFGILAVVVIHMTSYPVVRMRREPDSAAAIFYTFWNGISQFAVPAFIFLSGLVLFYNYWSPERRSRSWIGTFYRKRLLLIFVPYALWSFIYFLIMEIERGRLPFLNLGQFFLSLVTGQNYEHLYYFIMLSQFYILFPLLLMAVRSIKMARQLIPFVFVFQACFYFLNLHLLHWQSGDVFITYFLQFSLGALMGMGYENAMGKLRKWAGLFFFVFIGSGLCYVFAGRLYYEWVPALLPYKMYLNFIIYCVFTVSASLALLLAARFLSLHLTGALARALSAIGAGSFAIFLIHPLLLHYWRMAVVDRYGQYYHYLTLLGGAVVLFLSWAFYKMARRWKWSWILIGR
ncbi:acyltransferase [Paenibacillus caui]|uniref:acyltransferase n=1 Tax=Paenibacillus caui TaxID=2873927 RepID=UPI001CA91F31|nr:acyltransferase [Paenibacillus caui]